MFEITVDEIYHINETKYKTRFQPLETLARGSFGVVIKALDLNNNTEVAVKIIPKTNKNESSINQFKEEVKALAKINHPNIVKLHDYFETKDNMYFVMEYIRGGTLHEMLKKRENLFSEGDIRIITKNVLRAVEHLHKLNICHRDIKPDNIMFAHYNDISSIKLIDFGLSTQSCDNIQIFCGTFSFMAPERLLKLNYSEKSDIWSIGIVTYMLLKKGKHPFYSNKESKETYAIKFKDYSTQKALSSSGLSLVCIHFLKKVLDIKASTRYPASFALQHPWITQENSVLRNNILREEMDRINPSIKNAFLSIIFLSQLSKVNKKNRDIEKDKEKEKESNDFVFIRRSYTKDDESKLWTGIVNMNSTRRSKNILLKNTINMDAPIITPQNKKYHIRISSQCPPKNKQKIYLKSEGNSGNNSNISNSNSQRNHLGISSSSKFKNDSSKKAESAGIVSPFQSYNPNQTKKNNNFDTSTNRFLSKMTILSKFKNIESKRILTQPSEQRKIKVYLPLIKPTVTIQNRFKLY